MNRKPNIIFILNDHQAFYGHGKMVGGPNINKPNLDRLATEGVEFSQAYTACPLCGPARRTILTGLFPHNHGEIKNESNYKYDKEIYLNLFAKAGYKNYYFGKWHAGKGTALDFQCEGFSCSGYGNPYITPEYKQYLKRNNLPQIQVKIQTCFIDTKDSYAKALGVKEGEFHNPNFLVLSEDVTGIMTTPKETHESFFLATLACEKLKEISENKKLQPFHLRVDFWGPHQPYFATPEFLNLYDPKKIPELPSFRDNLEDKPQIYRLNNNFPISKNGKLIFPSPLPWSEWQKVLALNYAQQSLIDDAGGIVLKALEEYGLIDNTMIVWASDHGDSVGCHGGHFDKDAYMPQEMMRVPTVIKYPDIIPKGVKCDKLISNIDLAPTFLEATGIRFSERIDGNSLIPLCTEKHSQWRDDLMCETHGHWNTHVGRMIVTDRYKYIWNENDKDEFYDLKKDPFELNNLIMNNEYVDLIEDMKSRLESWRLKTRDKVTITKIKGKKIKF